MTNSRPACHRIAILGGGISGLAAAYALARARQEGAPVEEFLIEASDRLGGVIRTERVEGFIVEGGPDSFLTEKPEAAVLCRELGLGSSLLGSNDTLRRTYILHKGALVPLPEGLQLFVPTRLWPVFNTPLLSLRGKLRIAAEWFTFSSSTPATDESVANFVRRHFGSEVLENIADPLLAGVFGGDSDALSVRSALPRLWEMEQEYGSLSRAVLAVRKQRRVETQGPAPRTVDARQASPSLPPPLFTTLRDGLEQMTQALSQHLARSRIFLGQRVITIEPARTSGEGSTAAVAAPNYTVRCAVGKGDSIAHPADAIILALPAHQCARLLSSFDSALAGPLKAIPYAPALTVALGYGTGYSANFAPGFGFLVPKRENRSLLACTFVQNKFAPRVPPGKALLRCFLGGCRAPEMMGLSDDEILSIVRRELRTILNLSAEPLFYRIHRWPSSMPQYPVGHQDLLKTIRTRLESHPRLFLAGNAYSGIGISDCIRTARVAAARALEVSRS